MTYPLIRTGRFLTGMLLVIVGLSSYGCGDTATVTEPAELGGLSASAGILEPKFTPATTNYTVKLFGNESSTTITASPRVAGDTIRINNQQTTSQTVTLASINTSAELSIVVTETGAGGTSKSYSVRVSREQEDTTLKDLSSSDGTLAPSPFVKTELAPSISGVRNGVTSITLTATKSDPNTVMVIEVPANPISVPAGTPAGKATVQLGGPGSATTVPITITGPKGGKTTYQVTIKRGASDNAFLGSLSISQGKLTFTPGRNDSPYEVSVPSGVDKVTVTGKPQDANATVQPNSQTITLLGPGQSTSITVGVTAQDGQTKQNYVIRVKQAALNGNNNLKSLAVSQGRLDSNFDPKDQQYNVSLLSNVTSVQITAAPEDGTATVVINNGQPINLGAPGPEVRITIPVVVTAQNRDTKTYNVTFTRAALGGEFNLRSLTVTDQTLSPTFSPSTTRYTLGVANNVSGITVNATPQDSGATLRLLVDNVQKANPISLPDGPSTTEIEIEVKAQNGSPKSYFISVSRAAPSSNANLSALSVTAGTTVLPLSSPFGLHTVNVAPEVGEVVVRATKDDANATMAIGGDTVSPGTKAGQATFKLNGAGGPPTTISFTVTPQSGVGAETYTITVNRPAAPTAPDPPAAIPDLLTADDSCPLKPERVGKETFTNDDCQFLEDDPTTPVKEEPLTRDDNVTNVTTPRFKIPQPGTGETPNLYVDGSKVDSTFDATTVTLKPTVALSGSNLGIQHKITSTVTNTTTKLESKESDALTITIATGQSGV